VVKVIAKKLVKNPESLQNEIDIMRRLDHPMIVRLYEAYEDEKNIYLVQE
jgi:calcium-dependent protein kinase